MEIASAFLGMLSSFGGCLNCFSSSPTLKINNRSFKILRLLGEVRQTPNTVHLHNNTN